MVSGKEVTRLLRKLPLWATMDRYNFLSSIHPINKQEYEALLANLHVKLFKKGEHIIVAGQIQKQIYFIKSGVQMCHLDKDDKTHVIAFTYPPNLCALPESFSEQKPSKYYFTCITDSEMEYLTYDDLQRIYETHKNIETLFRKINEKLLSGIVNLHLEFRTLSIQERFTTFCRRSPQLLQQVPHKYIASYLGIDATNFSKLFNSVKI
jgi:CRP-like cAMP-binding protein